MTPTPAQMVEHQKEITRTVLEIGRRHNMTPKQTILACIISAADIVFTHTKIPMSEKDALATVVKLTEAQVKVADAYFNRHKN